MNITKKEIEIDEEIKRKIEIICDFTNTKPVFKNGSIVKIENTNIAYLEPHKIYINNYLFLIFNETNYIFLNNLSNKYNLKDLEKIIKQLKL